MSKTKNKFERGDVLYQVREGMVEPVPSKVVLRRVGPNYELCSFNDPQLNREGMNARHIAKSTLPVTRVEAEFKLYPKASFRDEGETTDAEE